MRAIAISDIHGCLKTFQALVEENVQLTKGDTLYLLGDYIDRGPDSKGVIDYILQLQDFGYNVKCLTGNHEQMLLGALNALTNELKIDLFLHNGGMQTLDSYGLTLVDLLSHPHLEFFENLKYYIELEDYILVHAGFRFEEGGMFYNKSAMIWERSWYHKMDKKQLNGKIIVHGHTPQSVKNIKAMKHNMVINQYMNIDAGCFRYDKMCALDLTNRELYFQDSLDVVTFKYL
jgi:serine/threonine protein phosphatase 1